MPLKFFLNLYARLAGLTALVILLCIALFLGINSVRSQFWHERFSEPLMRWLASSPAPGHQYPWLDSLNDFQVGGAGELSLTPVIRERLGYGQVVAIEDGLGYRFLVTGLNGEVIQFRASEPYRDIALASAQVLRMHLDAASPEGRDEVLERLTDALKIGVLRVQGPEALPGDEVLERVYNQGFAFYRDNGEGLVLMQLADGELIEVSMPDGAFNPWAWPVTLLLLLVSGSALALWLIFVLRALDSNLRKVESVAVRIARGEMSARVDAGEGTVVSRLAAAFNGMAEHIQRLVDVQREMIHAVSHELRTPVARIRFGVQMIEDCQGQEALQKQLDGIDGDIQELDELIDEILTYARLEQGGPVFKLEEASVTEIVRQVVAEQQRTRPALSIESEIDESTEHLATADVEPRYIHRAIQNLVGNAGRYAAGRVLVRCHIDEDHCRVDVEDDGPGIPEEEWEKVFTAFARLDDSRTRTSGGYGLGLSIVRRILYWHNGQAFVSRSDGLGGARFSLVWPRNKPLEPDM
ncbi:ATP-binding protein [Marinobacter sp. F3R11]|uniref:ATP-binding protein n=1 Tax=Marinobacter sp. F3R11 TaxID=2267231 RepID=UPI000DE94F38|nr:ATP-binding protein [Marinobacter sp. F3R11]RBW50571.1 two-component sensor histidine kinase [Marinobacter sp. F3R11]